MPSAPRRSCSRFRRTTPSSLDARKRARDCWSAAAARRVPKPSPESVGLRGAAQNPGKGWRYSSRGGDNDTSVTGWAVLALRAAERGGLTFAKAAWEGALAWFDEVTDDAGRTGYMGRGFNAVF